MNSDRFSQNSMCLVYKGVLVEANLISLPGNHVSESTGRYVLYISADPFRQIYLDFESERNTVERYTKKRYSVYLDPGTVKSDWP